MALHISLAFLIVSFTMSTNGFTTARRIASQILEVVVFIASHFSVIQLPIVSKVVDRYVLIASQAFVKGSEKFSQIKFQGIMIISNNNPNNSSINIQATVRTFVIVSQPVSKEVLTSPIML